jgi:tuftelin-interacting protein 11
VALRMLQKMGYKGGGLGATGQGITAAIEAHKRGEKEGIGVRSEAKQLMPEKQQQDKEKEKKKKEKEKKKKKAKQESNWKIDIDDGSRKKKKVYKTAEELRAEAEEAGGLKQGEMRQASQHVSIVDMRGKEAKLVSGSDINQVEDTDADEAFTLPLIHNLDVLIEGSSSDIFNLQRNLSTEADSLVALKHEEAEAQRLCDEDRYHVSRLSSIIDILDRTHAQASDTAAEPLTLSGLADVFEELRSSYDSEYTLYGLASLAGPLLVPPMRRFLAKWNVLDEPHGPAPAIKAWRGLLRSDRGGAVSDGGDAVAFVQLVDNVVMPKILAASAGWEPRSMTEKVVRLAEAWEPVLPPRQFVTLMETVVVPKLREAADLWDPKHDPTPVHLWMHPWLPFIPERLEEIYPVIRYKIGVCLAEWHPSDPSAIAILSPWATVFKKQHMEALLVRCVLPKLAMALREMPINPAAQTLDAFRWLTAWVGVAPLDQIAAIFEAEFFPRWLSVLFQWLTRSPDYDEVTRWYLNWKSLFPDKLSAHEKIKVHFTRALDIMNNVVSGAQILGGYVQPGTKENLDYLKVTESRGGGVGGGGAAGGGAGAKKDVPMPASKPKMSIVDANHDRTVSFKEALEQLAEDNEILFLPKVGKQEKGKQVYTFGKISVYLDNRLVYALSAGEWRPMALDELLEAAKKKK